MPTVATKRNSCSSWIVDALQNQNNGRESKWTVSIAVGGEKYIDKIKHLLGVKATGRRKLNRKDAWELREPISPYNDIFTPEKVVLKSENMYYLNVFSDKSIG